MELAHRALWAIRSVNMNYNEACELYKEKLKKVHDANLRKRAFEEAQKVWLYNFKLKLFPGKLKSKWMGPVMIPRVGRFGDVEIENIQDQTK